MAPNSAQTVSKTLPNETIDSAPGQFRRPPGLVCRRPAPLAEHYPEEVSGMSLRWNATLHSIGVLRDEAPGCIYPAPPDRVESGALNGDPGMQHDHI